MFQQWILEYPFSLSIYRFCWDFIISASQFGSSKITYLGFHFRIRQYVIRFNVGMNDLRHRITVKVRKALGNTKNSTITRLTIQKHRGFAPMESIKKSPIRHKLSHYNPFPSFVQYPANFTTFGCRVDLKVRVSHMKASHHRNCSHWGQARANAEDDKA